MKKYQIIIFLLIIVLTGCSQTPVYENTKEEVKQTIQSTPNEYKTQIPVKPSPIRGIVGQTDAFINFNDMEKSLMDIIKKYVDVNKYIYSPGQILTADDVNQLIGRESSDNPNGLNLKETKNLKDAPIYANTLIEQDYFTYENDKKIYNTIGIGVGLDSTYKYDDNEEPKNISDEEIKEFVTQFVGNKLVEFIRSKEGMENVNILVGIFKESDDGIVPGGYVSYGYIPKDKKSIEKVESVNVNYEVFPNEEEKYEQINNILSELEAKVEAYFTSYNAMTTLGKIEDNQLVEIDSKITMSTYSEVEMEIFEQYIIDNIGDLKKLVPKIEIDIVSATGKNIGIITLVNGQVTNKYVYENNF